MSDSIKTRTVTAAIAGLVISVIKADGNAGNVTIRDVNALTEIINPQDCPILSPRARGFISDVEIMRDSYGGDASLKRISYNLTYDFFYTPALEGAGLFEKYDNMVDAAIAVLLALATNTALNGATDVIPSPVSLFGPIEDTTGQVFHGCQFVLRVMQFLEA